ncbi:MAG: hypothetical protein HY328_05680 [Chloroflexi bacterium]|nr:hypothetical protein [Chloroflexota bacterium]
MTMQVENMTRRLIRVFAPEQATVLAETIHDAYADLVKTSDFNELKEIVRNLAQAQTRTESRMNELAEAQTRTESRMEELAEAQTRTELRVEELAQEQRTFAKEQRTFAQELQTLAQAQRELTDAQKDTDTRLGKLIDVVTNLAQEVGGLSRSASYALENEAYRQLPAYLEANHGIVL